MNKRTGVLTFNHSVNVGKGKTRLKGNNLSLIRPQPVEGYISYRCKINECKACTSLRCSHSCHEAQL